METIFLSYVREDQVVVDRLAADLTSLGAEVWLDRTSIEPGVPWEDAIRNAISSGTYFVPCFSSSYTGRTATYMDEEVKIACSRFPNVPGSRTWLLPVNLDGSVVPTFSDERHIINKVEHVVMHPSWEDGLKRLAEATVQMTKKQIMKAIDRLADELIELELELFRAERDLDQERFIQIKQTTAARVRDMTAGPQPGHYTPTSMNVPMDLSGYHERVARATAKLAGKRTEYDARVREFLTRYGEDYHPYSEKLDQLETEKEAIATKMRRQEVDNETFARSVMVAIFVIIALAVLLRIALG